MLIITTSVSRVVTETDSKEDDDPLGLIKQKHKLDEEKRKFTEAAVRLGQERRQFEVGVGQSLK